jgi:CheY-specific phosphatase CheX
VKMEIIQPFINATDAVLGQTLHCSTRVEEVCMVPGGVPRQGVAAVVNIHGDIEGRIVFDVATETARSMAQQFLGSTEESLRLVDDVVCELANQVIGNAVTALNDSGYKFRVRPPEITSIEQVSGSSMHTEALRMKFETGSGPVFLNIALTGRADMAAD